MASEPWTIGTFTANVEVLKKAVATEAAAAVEDVAQYILSQSVQQVPHEDGDLQASGKVSTDPAQQLAAVSYDTPYAVVQHEELSYKHDAGRKAKYLEDPFNDAAKGPAKKIIERRLKGK